jgi:arylsulfatase A-like enzyme
MGYADNTYVIITSDNGYHLGEKDFLFKNSLWERSARVPLIVSGPNCATGLSCDQPVSLLDLYPTINEWLDISNTPGPTPLGGHSFASLANKPSSNWEGPSMAVTAIGSSKPASASTPAVIERQHYSIRSKTHRYLYYSNGEEELYDHTTDPYEWHNISNKEESKKIKEEMKTELIKQVGL